MSNTDIVVASPGFNSSCVVPSFFTSKAVRVAFSLFPAFSPPSSLTAVILLLKPMEGKSSFKLKVSARCVCSFSVVLRSRIASSSERQAPKAAAKTATNKRLLKKVSFFIILWIVYAFSPCPTSLFSVFFRTNQLKLKGNFLARQKALTSNARATHA